MPSTLDLSPKTLRYYERAGLIMPSRSRGRIRLYSRADVERIRQVQRLIDELGVNLAGAEIIINMSGRIRLYSRADLERIRQVQRLIDELGVNLAGAEVIIDMSARLRALEAENETLRRELQRLRDLRLPAPREVD